MTNTKSMMENKLLRLCNKIYRSNFKLVDVIVVLEDDSCTLNCLNRNHTVFLEMDVDLEYFQGAYEPTNKMHCILTADISNMELDLERKVSGFQETQMIDIHRLHHFFHDGYQKFSFKEFKKVAECDCDNVLIECNGFNSMFFPRFLKEPLLDIPDTFGLNLHEDSNPLYLEYSYDFFTVKAVVAPRVTPVESAEFIVEVNVDD